VAFRLSKRIVRFQAGQVPTIRAAFLAACRSLRLLVIFGSLDGVLGLFKVVKPADGLEFQIEIGKRGHIRKAYVAGGYGTQLLGGW